MQDESPPENQLSLALALKAIGGGLWDYDIDADKLSCNSRWYEIMGLDLSISEITCMADFMPHIHPDDVEHATELDPDEIEALIASDGRYYNEFRIVRPCGEIRRVRSIACVVVDPQTGHRRAVGCFTDLTEASALRDFASHWPMGGRPGAPPPNPKPPGAAAQGREDLSPRERECLRWITLGKTAAETGIILNLSKRTVEFHINNAIRKLGAANKIHATMMAIEGGLL